MNEAASFKRRVNTSVAGFAVGIPLAVAVLGAILLGPWRNTPVGALIHRYVSHPVECVEVAMFCCALGVLLAKFRQLRIERAALHADAVPDWDGHATPISGAGPLLARLQALTQAIQNTYFVQRVGNVLNFVVQRRSANELDDQLRALADSDAIDIENSYSLVRFITWAMPILGFVGTVLGITGAIAGVTPELLEHSMSNVTDGLALAFDATALALSLTMGVMFFSFLVERQEQQLLEEVDRNVERLLAHRFQRTSAESGPFIGVIQQATQAMLETTEKLVVRQAELWSQALATVDRRAADSHGKAAAAIESALERTLAAHTQRLAGIEKQGVDQVAGLAAAVRDTAREQQAALARTAEAVSAQSAVLGRLFEGEKQLLQIQAVLQQNLAALEGAGAFEQAVHSLSAAVHLLTAKVGRSADSGPIVVRTSTGKAA